MKHLMLYSILLLASQTDNIAGVMRGLRDINTLSHLEIYRANR
jgi:hypothetical protein